MFNVLVCLLGTLVLIMGAVSAFSLGPERTVLIKVKAVDPSNDKTPEYMVWDGTEVTVHPARARVGVDFDAAKPSASELDALARKAVRTTRASDVTGVLFELYWGAIDEKIRHQIEGTAFARLLETVAAESDDRYFVVLVRPSGFETFTPLRDFLIRQGADVGYEPIEQSFNVRVR